MNGEYPVIIDGRNLGTLKVYRDGLMTVFEAECDDVQRLIRLSVFSPEGEEGRLGVMLPENGVLRIRKCFSRAALESMPDEIFCAAESGNPFDGDIPPRQQADEGTECEPEQEQDKKADEQPDETPECETQPQNQDTVWFPLPEGTLVSVQEPYLVAMPWREGIIPGQERIIQGKRYVIISPGEIAIPAE